MLLAALYFWRNREPAQTGEGAQAANALMALETGIAPRDCLLTETELAFYTCANQVLPTDLYLCPKVRLEDFVKAKTNCNTVRNRIKSRHLDFVVVRSKNFHICAVIELDDASHRRAKQRDSDAVKDTALRAAGLELLRVPVARYYDRQELGAFFKKFSDQFAA